MAFPFFKAQPKPLLIAHRGASAYAPENTLPAFKLAMDMGARFIELDVHQTKDGQVVVMHDGDFKRSAGLNRKIRHLTFEDISKIKIKRRCDDRYADARVPALEEALTLIGRRAVVNVEIKQPEKPYPGIEEKVLALLERKGYNGMSFVSSFSFECLERVRSLHSGMHLGCIVGDTPLKLVIKKMRELRCEALSVAASQAARPLIRRAHQRGFHVCVYTVNERSLCNKLAARRVDAIFTDYPDLLGAPEFQEPTLGMTSGE